MTLEERIRGTLERFWAQMITWKLGDLVKRRSGTIARLRQRIPRNNAERAVRERARLARCQAPSTPGARHVKRLYLRSVREGGVPHARAVVIAYICRNMAPDADPSFQLRLMWRISTAVERGQWVEAPQEQRPAAPLHPREIVRWTIDRLRLHPLWLGALRIEQDFEVFRQRVLLNDYRRRFRSYMLRTVHRARTTGTFDSSAAAFMERDAAVNDPPVADVLKYFHAAAQTEASVVDERLHGEERAWARRKEQMRRQADARERELARVRAMKYVTELEGYIDQLSQEIAATEAVRTFAERNPQLVPSRMTQNHSERLTGLRSLKAQAQRELREAQANVGH